MNKKNKKYVYYSLIIIFLLIIWFLTLIIGSELFVIKDRNFINNFSGSFFGALFSACVLFFSWFFGKRYMRNIKHLNTLIKLEHFFNRALNTNSDNINFTKSLIKAIKSKTPYISQSNIIELDNDVLLNLKNIDIANDIFSIFIDIEKINKSLKLLDNWYSKLLDKFVDKQIDSTIFLKLLNQNYLDKLEELLNKQERLDGDMENIIAKINALRICDKTFLNNLMDKMQNFKYTKEFYTILPGEIEIVKEGRKKVAEESKQDKRKKIN